MLNRLIGGQIGEEELFAARNYPGANAAAIITLPAIITRQYVPGKVLWSYSNDPTGGRFTVQDGVGNIILDFDIMRGGPGALQLSSCIGTPNTDMTFTLFAGGAGITGKLNIEYLVRLVTKFL